MLHLLILVICTIPLGVSFPIDNDNVYGQCRLLRSTAYESPKVNISQTAETDSFSTNLGIPWQPSPIGEILITEDAVRTALDPRLSDYQLRNHHVVGVSLEC